MKKSRLLGALCVCMLIVASQSAKAVSVTSPSANELLGATVIDFNNFTTGNYSSLSVAGAEITGTGTFQILNAFTQLVISGNGFLNNSNTNWAVTITFDSIVSAFGIWSGAIDENWTYTALDSQGGIIESIITNTSRDPIFHGIAANGIKSVVMSNVASDIAIFDDLYFVPSVTTVPVPPALLLFGSGLLGLVGMVRRKKAA